MAWYTHDVFYYHDDLYGDALVGAVELITEDARRLSRWFPALMCPECREESERIGRNWCDLLDALSVMVKDDVGLTCYEPTRKLTRLYPGPLYREAGLRYLGTHESTADDPIFIRMLISEYTFLGNLMVYFSSLLSGRTGRDYTAVEYSELFTACLQNCSLGGGSLHEVARGVAQSQLMCTHAELFAPREVASLLRHSLEVCWLLFRDTSSGVRDAIANFLPVAEKMESGSLRVPAQRMPLEVEFSERSIMWMSMLRSRLFSRTCYSHQLRMIWSELNNARDLLVAYFESVEYCNRFDAGACVLDGDEISDAATKAMLSDADCKAFYEATAVSLDGSVFASLRVPAELDESLCTLTPGLYSITHGVGVVQLQARRSGKSAVYYSRLPSIEGLTV